MGWPSDAVGIKGLSRGEIEALVADLGQPRYRAGQITRWLYARGALAFDEMTDLPADVRETLAAQLALPTASVVAPLVSAVDDTRKYLLALADGTTIETVGLPDVARLTACISTQAGCAMGCTFCATGIAGFARDLAPGEMVDEVRAVSDDFGRRVTNVVAMGQGEPFANYDAVLAALRFMNSPDGLGIGARHITISTCGLVQGIRRLAEEPEQFTLAVSLHSAVQRTRDRLMPGVRGVPLAELRAALVAYAAATSRRPSLEYALISGVNDTDVELEALVSFARGMLVHVNLIPANPVAGAGLERAAGDRVRRFASRLQGAGVESTVRAERGADIDSACGQLRQRHEVTGAS